MKHSVWRIFLSSFFLISGNIWAQSIHYVTSIQETTFDNQSVEAIDFIDLQPGVDVAPTTTQLFDFFFTPSPGCFTPPAEDINQNWNKEITYDLDGSVVSYSISYSDHFGRPIQTQTKNIEENKIFVSETLYDNLGKAVLTTLPAPSQYCDFVYLANFTRNANGVKYSLSDFDQPTTSANASGEVFNPVAVGATDGTTGWYYSTLNEFEPFTPAVSYPYVRSFSAYPEVVTQGGPSIVTNYKTGKQTMTASLPVQDELDHYSQKSSYYVSNSRVLPLHLEGTGFTKSVIKDANGNEVVVFYDSFGALVATADVDLSSSALVQYTSTASTKNYQDIHLTSNNLASLSITCSSNVNVLDLQTGLNIYTGSPSSLVTTGWSSGYYRIKSTDGTSFVGTTFNTSYSHFTYYYYNEAGQLIATVDPNFTVPGSEGAYVTSYTYNSLGWPIRHASRDEGLTELVYRKDGQVRFSKNAKQQAVPSGTVAIGGVNYSKTFSYTQYDRFARAVESGEYQGTLTGTGVYFIFQPQDVSPATVTSTYESTLDIVETISTATPNLDAARCADRHYVNYRTTEGSTAVTTVGSTSYIQRNVAGGVGSTQNSYSQTWCSYDNYGRLEWAVQNVYGLGYKTLDYTYDAATGNVLQVAYQKTQSDQFYHAYSYDDNQRLSQVQTSADGSTWQTEAAYDYYLHGPLKRLELGGNVQGVDYLYTIEGALKSLNHFALDNTNDPGKDGYTGSAFAKDAFGLTFNYYDNDYISGAYNSNALTTFGAFSKASIPATGYATTYAGGLPYALAWTNAGNTSQALPYVYNYSYDSRYWMTNALFGTLSGATFTPESTNVHNESAIQYDANGNITSLTRGTTTYGYSFSSNTNRVSAVTNYASAYTYTGNGEVSTMTNTQAQVSKFTHNSLGQMNSFTPSTNAATKYTYSDQGYRTSKASYDASGTLTGTVYSVRDLSGNVLSTYTKTAAGTISQIEVPIYGLGRLAVATPQTNSGSRTFDYNYELQDHLGNTRVRFLRPKTSGKATIVYSSDYYPYGLPFNAIGSTIPRNTYQGQYAEKDGESGLQHFELRNYDPVIGRWMSPDPYGQYPSSYLGMGNNPVTGVDPDGGWNPPKVSAASVNEGVEMEGTNAGEIWKSENGNWVPTKMRDGYEMSEVSVYSDGKVREPSQAFSAYATQAPNAYQKGMYGFVDRSEIYLGTMIGMAMGNFTVGFGARAYIANTGGRVFWSGNGNTAVEVAARKFATENGMTTLEMTRAGQNLEKLTKGMPWEKAGPMWRRISGAFAKGVKGPVHVFQNEGGIGIGSVWGTIEYPILKQKGIDIIYHVIP